MSNYKPRKQYKSWSKAPVERPKTTFVKDEENNTLTTTYWRPFKTCTGEIKFHKLTTVKPIIKNPGEKINRKPRTPMKIEDSVNKSTIEKRRLLANFSRYVVNNPAISYASVLDMYNNFNIPQDQAPPLCDDNQQPKLLTV